MAFSPRFPRSVVAAAPLVAAALLSAAPVSAAPCVVPSDCPSGFCVDSVCCDVACDEPCEACSGAKKGNGVDGTCGLAAAGTICLDSYCDGPTFSFVDDSKCDNAGNCVAPAAQSCFQNNPCKLDLCADEGCENVTVLDGTPCGSGMACTNGVCGGSSSSSGSGGGSGSGSGSGGGGGSGSGGGSGGSGGSSSATGGGDIYPDKQKEIGGCGCRTTAGSPAGASLALAAALACLLRRRRRPTNAA